MSERFILRARVIRCMVYDRFFRLDFGDTCDLVMKVTKPLLLWEHESCLKRPPPPPPHLWKKKLNGTHRNKTVKQNRFEDENAFFDKQLGFARVVTVALSEQAQSHFVTQKEEASVKVPGCVSRK